MLRRARATLEHRYGGWDSACRRAVLGPAAAVAEQISRYAAAGVEEMVLGLVAETVTELDGQMAYVADKVMPRVAG